MRAPEAPPIEPRHRRSAAPAPRRGFGGRWLPVGVVMAVAAVCAGVYVVDQLTVPPEIAQPDLLSLIPPTPDVPPVLAAPAAVDSAPSAEPEATDPTTEEAGLGEATESVSTGSPTRRASAGNAPSGLAWRSGVSVGTPDEVAAWESYRGRAVDVVHAFTERDSWEGIESASWILDFYADSPVAIVISQPYWPEGSGGTLQECAAGAYDANWATYGASLTSAGRTDVLTRLAWEFNGDWFEWSATDVGAWKQCWRSVVQAVRTTAPEARFEWAMNAHGSQTSDGDAWKSYPGDDVVDVIGIDPYDHYPSSPTAAEFDEQCRGSEGLCSVIAFARAHGKGVGVGEWGVINSGIGDNPVYIDKMFETFEAGADVMEYETYFNYAQYATRLDDGSNPRSSESYLANWGS